MCQVISGRTCDLLPHHPSTHQPPDSYVPGSPAAWEGFRRQFLFTFHMHGEKKSCKFIRILRKLFGIPVEKVSAFVTNKLTENTFLINIRTPYW